MGNIKIGTRLFITFGILIIILIITSSLILNQMGEISKNSDEIINKRWELAKLTQKAIAVSNTNVRNTLLLFLLADKEPESQKVLQADMKENSRKISEITINIDSKLETQEEKDLFQLVKGSRTSYLDSENRAISLLDQKKYDEAVFVLLTETKSFLDTYHTDLRDLSDFQGHMMEKATKHSLTLYSEARVIALISILFAVVLAAIISIFVTRSITFPVLKAVNAANKVAIGDLDQSIDSANKDEIGQLLRAMKDMISYLREMASTADLIAGGNLEAQVEPRSEKDRFGNSLKAMIISLHTSVSSIRKKNEELDKKNSELIQLHKRADRIFSALAESLPGTVLDGKYQLDEKIGAGGFGAVYKATHLTMKRPIAVKVFKPSPGNDSAEGLERFRFEAISASLINHLNAVTVFDSGISTEGIAYLVMELLSGKPLGNELREKKMLSLSRFAEIIIPVCNVLSKAHEAGIIHRDIKPDNVFLHKIPEGETVKVVDFGIAKLMDTGAGLDIKDLTATGAIIGTPTYTAPERFEDKPYDGRADVYSLGIMMYEMLCGQVPFAQGDGGMLAIMVQHIMKNPPPLRSINPNIPEAVETIIMRTLEKNPDARPTAKELAEAIIAQPAFNYQGQSANPS
jgi:HAMP domain-containing protein